MDGAKLMPDPDYKPSQQKNEGMKDSLGLKPRPNKQTNNSTMQCQYCLAMITPNLFAFHNSFCNTFKKNSNGLFVCEICSESCSMSGRYYHLKMKHKDTLESKENQNNQVMKEYYHLKMKHKDTLESKDNQNNQVMKETESKVEEQTTVISDFDIERKKIHENPKEPMDYASQVKHKDTLELKNNQNDEVMKNPEFKGTELEETVQQELIQKRAETSSNSEEIQNQENTESKTSIEGEKASDKSDPKKQCQSCQEMINLRTFELHFDSCKIYSPHIIKSLTGGYECKACQFKVPLNKWARSTMNCHLKVKHKIGNQNEKSDNECDICHEKIVQRSFLSHYRACKLYFHFMTKSSDGYKCKLCPFKNNSTQARTAIHRHINKKHPNREGLDKSRNNEPRINLDSEPLIMKI